MSALELLAQIDRQTIIEVNGVSGQIRNVLSNRFHKVSFSRVIFVEDENTKISRDTFEGSSPNLYPVYVDSSGLYEDNPELKCFLVHPSFIIQYARNIFREVDVAPDMLKGILINAACRMVVDTLFTLDIGRPPIPEDITLVFESLSQPKSLPLRARFVSNDGFTA